MSPFPLLVYGQGLGQGLQKNMSLHRLGLSTGLFMFLIFFQREKFLDVQAYTPYGIEQESNTELKGKLNDDIVNDYYTSIDPSLVDDDMKLQLQTLLATGKVELDYNTIWQAFEDVDQYLWGYPCNTQNSTYIPDVYSAYCWDPEKGSDPGHECGTYKKEGDCFNREHIWPKSWFGGFDEGFGAQTDLFELWPSDGYVNALRANYPLGNVEEGSETYISTNGSKLGKCKCSDSLNECGNICFEIADPLKGDIARSYFYLATLYWNVWLCCDEEGVNKSDIKPWLEEILREWHILDPVDSLESSRNDVIYEKWQKNRNPFIDHPEWVDSISDF